MPTRDWQGRSLEDPEWDGDGGCVAVIGLIASVAVVAFVVGVIVGRWLG